MFSSRGVGVGFSSFICSSQPSRLGRSSPYGMDLLPVLVGGTGVRYLLLVLSSLSVGVFQFWSFGLGLGGFCSSPLVVARLWRGFNLFLAPGSFVAGSQLQMFGGVAFLNVLILTK
ncbi:hypothetical protein Bca4012_095128 [Brassica carinata]|uniref:Transmembrane protein n=1 Tax=Brassica carinata TaxID=52824 RepID=A0A8X7PTK3_BRACI|nr:hypothetical protein Bca52824_077170 [Brassica carinata]